MGKKTDEDKEFEKFLMKSISGSEGSGLISSRNMESKLLEWNITSSEEISARKSRFLKTDEKVQEEQDELSAQCVNISSSITDTNPTDDLQEFADRLAQQNSALKSLGKSTSQKGYEGVRGTLESLAELRESMEDSQSMTEIEDIQNDIKNDQETNECKNVSALSPKSGSRNSENESICSSKSEADKYGNESIFSDASESDQCVNESITLSKSDLENSDQNVKSFNQILSNPNVSPAKVTDDSRGSDSASSNEDSEEEFEGKFRTDLTATPFQVIHNKNQILGTLLNSSEEKILDNDDLSVKQLPEDNICNEDLIEPESNDENDPILHETKDVSIYNLSLPDACNSNNLKPIDIDTEFIDDVSSGKTQPEDQNEKKAPTKTKSKTTKTIYDKQTDWSHVQGSGYGPSPIKKKGRPKISPRLHAKVENAKRERIAKITHEPLNEEVDENFMTKERVEITEHAATKYSGPKSDVENEQENDTKKLPVISKKEIFENDIENIPPYTSSKVTNFQNDENIRKNQSNFVNNEVVKRLENLLKIEENMRRDIEITARNLKIEVQEKQQMVLLKETEIEELVTELTRLKQKHIRLKQEQDHKCKTEEDLKKQVEHWKTVSNNAYSDQNEFSVSREKAFTKRLQNLENEKNVEIKKIKNQLSSLKINPAPIISKPKPPTLSFGVQTEIKGVRTEHKIIEHIEVGREKAYGRESKPESHQKCQMDSDRKQLIIEKLEQENARLHKVETEIHEMSKQLEQFNQLRAEKTLLEGYLRNAFDDRKIFEERSNKGEELLKVAQTEIDKRHSLIIELHENSKKIIEDLKSSELQKQVLEADIQNLQYEIEHVRQASVPENVAMISAKLAEMERERHKRESELRATLVAKDPQFQHIINDQSHVINKLKSQLNTKSQLYAKSQTQIKELKVTVNQLKDQLKSFRLQIC